MIPILRSLRGNARACVYTEPLWGIPHSLFIPYFTLYMFQLNVKDAQIGVLISIGLLVQLFSAMIGGALTVLDDPLPALGVRPGFPLVPRRGAAQQPPANQQQFLAVPVGGGHRPRPADPHV
jgi:hypothetical protein